jgi:hypothetical protein
MEREGMVYFLEAGIVREFKEGWPSEKGKQAFWDHLIRYAINDA